MKTSQPLNVSLQLAKKIIKACCVLHNYVCMRDGYAFHHTLSIKGLVDINNTPSLHKYGWTVRDEYANYFISPAGAVPWQDSKI
ncbi:hypothetical protein NQ314_006435 [Rhamnusium bicolor]|uniref:DDE Tnp4 domain-containing protein n=1 Tax=Rhamnusium bicolor TaxID=1586634 RepID=A0AAV8Z353_9CUCU|nr:hypothetical protein NQ314_006435 [Rhamnusium bicolor]